METSFSFPEELRPFLMNYSKSSFSESVGLHLDLEKTLTDSKIRTSFQNWLSQHSELSVKSPAIFKINLISTEIDKKENLKHTIPQKFLRLSRIFAAILAPHLSPALQLSREYIKTSSLLRKIEQGRMHEINRIDLVGELRLLIEYLDLGIITLEEVATLLTSDGVGGHVFFMSDAEKIMPKLLDRFSNDQLHLVTKILCTQEKKGGMTAFLALKSCKCLVPILKKYIPSHLDQIEQILLTKNKREFAPLDIIEISEIWELLNAYIPNHMDELTSLLVKRSKCVKITESELSLLKSYIPNHMEKLTEILSAQDELGNTLLNYQAYKDNFEILFPLLQKFIPEHEDLLINILSVKNKGGFGILNHDRVIQSFLKWLDNLIPSNVSLLIKILSIIGYNNRSIFETREFKPLLFKLYYSHPQEFMNLMCGQNSLGKTVFHYDNKINDSLLKRVSNAQFSQIMSIADYNGDTPLHTQSIFETHKDRIELAKLTELLDFENKERLSVRKCQTYVLSPSWITRQKYTDETYIQYSSKEYQRVSSQVEKSIETLWNGLSFNLDGSNEKGLSPALLIVEGKKYTPEEIKKTLSEMLGLIKKKQAWLGTPSGGPLLDKFYDVMLHNLRELVSTLETNKNPAEIGGYLISIATVRLEKRCAAAYQAEIRQKKHLALGKTVSLDTLIKDSAAIALTAQIEKIVSSRYANDSHAMNQFLYATGLTPEPDALSKITVESAQKLILKNWSLPTFYRDFANGFSREFAVDWLKQQTPDDFSPAHLDKIREVKEIEQRLQDDHFMSLIETMTEDKTSKALLFFRTVHAHQISSLTPLETKEEMIAQIFAEGNQRINHSIDLSLLVDNSLLNKDQWPVFKKKFVAALRKHRQDVVENFPKTTADEKKFGELCINFKNTENVILGKLEAVLAFDNFSNKMNLNAFERKFILSANQMYQKGIAELRESLKEKPLKILYSPTEFSLPSQAIENARQLEFAKPDLDNHLNILLKILKSLGATIKK